MPTAPSRVFTVHGMMPEEIAYGGARFSRSNKSFAENVADITREKSIKFFNANYHGYGHGSIADMAHGALVMENISILAAIAVEDQALWDGMECSTRYIDFGHPNYVVPEELSPDEREAYVATVEQLFAAYRELLPVVHAFVRRAAGETDEFTRGQKNQVRARAFDLLRGLLPMAAQTHVFQITSGRALEAQIARLREHRAPEVRALGEHIQVAAQADAPWTPDGRAAPSLFPTIVKYTEPSAYPAHVRAQLAAAAARLDWRPEPNGGRTVGEHAEVAVYAVGLADAPAGLMYAELGGVWPEAQARAAALGSDFWREVLQSGRGRYDAWPRALQQAPLFFDFALDLGAFRDLHRHRRTTQLVPPYAPLGYNVPQTLLEVGAAEPHAKAIEGALACAEALNAAHPESRLGDYALPLATRIRFGMMMDLAEAEYLIRLRSGIKGHFAYREAAVKMGQALQAHLRELPWASGIEIEYTPYGGEMEGILER